MKLSNEIKQTKKQPPEKFTINLSEFEPLWKQIISTQGKRAIL